MGQENQPTHDAMYNGRIMNNSDFEKNHIRQADPIEEIEFEEWKKEDCVVTDIDPLPYGQKKFARTIEGLLSEKECEALIACTEEQGYEQAAVHGGNKAIVDTSYRKS